MVRGRGGGREVSSSVELAMKFRDTTTAEVRQERDTATPLTLLPPRSKSFASERLSAAVAGGAATRDKRNIIINPLGGVFLVQYTQILRTNHFRRRTGGEPVWPRNIRNIRDAFVLVFLLLAEHD